jgi:stage II sporulation protein D
MHFKSFLLFIFLFCLTSILQASDYVKVNLYNGSSLRSVGLRIHRGSYVFLVDGKKSAQLNGGNSLQIRAEQGKVVYTINGKQKTATGVAFQAQGHEEEFLLRPASQKLKEHKYQDHLIVKARGNALVLVNEVFLDKYVAGVVEAEAGARHTHEYYKVQSIISRTYALANLNRHEAQGYHLCDQVHCQVYHGKARFNDSIPLATKATEDLVLVDQDIQLITAAFSSNCGGKTLNAEDVWSQSRSYLVSVPDTFCLVMPNSHWEKRIPKVQWYGFLKERHFPLDDTTRHEANFYFPSDKNRYFSDTTFSIKSSDVRSKFKLRSSFFTVQDEGEQMYLIGRGFGHGVGLCQEGAIRMAALGTSYRDILHYYYTDVHLIDRKNIDFFRSEIER